jgi:hypothetical protein
MSLVSDAISTAIGTLNGALGQTIEYRAGISGSWTTLTTAVLIQGAPVLIGYDDQRRAIIAPSTARLKVATGATRLVSGTPTKPGYQVRHTLGANVTEWAVIAAAHSDAQSVYELARAVPQQAGDARGATP